MATMSSQGTASFSALNIALESPQHIEVDLHQTTDAFANAIVRAANEEVSVMAISSCLVLTNGTDMPKPELASRLGKLRLGVDRRQLNSIPEPSECVCYRPPEEYSGGYDTKYVPSRCHTCTTTFHLSVRNTDLLRARVVTELDLVYKAGPRNVVPHRIHIGGRHAPTPIVELPPGESIELFAFATKGVGRLHANYRSTRTESMRSLETAMGKTAVDENVHAAQDRVCDECVRAGRSGVADIKCLRLAIETHAPHRAVEVIGAAIDALHSRARAIERAARTTLEVQRSELDPERSESFWQFLDA